MDLANRRAYLGDNEFSLEGGTLTREYVCIAEIWCECFGQKKEDMNRYKTREINSIVKNIPGWEPVGTTKSFPIYGKQRYFRRKNLADS